MNAAEKGLVVVGLSGGVDSSVAALRLLAEGWRVEGLFMKNWEEDDGTEACTALRDLADAEAVCRRLGIRLHVANFAAEYWESVFEHFLAEHRSGRTPNPDVLCNREIKFKVFLDYARELGAEWIATGHYARVRQRAGHWELLCGVDAAKDQSYFLHAVSEQALARTLFPLGELRKEEVRHIAARHGLPVASKKDSTGICFIGERRFREFLARYLPRQPGPIETPEGRVLGRHEGLAYYTLGQRRGLGVGGVRGAGDRPWYVADKDFARNALIVVQGADHPFLYSRALRTESFHWINGTPVFDRPLLARTRHRQPLQVCRAETLPDGRLQVTFERPQWAVTPGQSVVLYDGERCLGGGVIAEAVRDV
ncbi:MAG: tRNA-specific 2-thiouridylase MnmA [Porticoccaceae bacterium]|nr:MAG: tRNA-specific 2-thiouridylase MnmA [Porticoccaceae bacterium]